MTAPQRMRAWGAGVAGGHLVLGAVAALALGVPRAALLFGLCALVTLALALLVAPLLRPRRDDGGNGGACGAEPEPPPWWPAFERDFRAYDEARRRLTALRP